MKSLTAKKSQEKTLPNIPITNNISVDECNADYIKNSQNPLFSKRFLKQRSIANKPIIEYIQITARSAIAVTEDSVWVRTFSDGSSFPIQPPTNNIYSIETTKKLLDTAIVLGKRVASVERQLPGLSVENWLWSLIGQYHLTHPTPQLMREAARRFKAQGRQQLAEWAEEKAIEETGHDRLALLDIQSLGYQAQALVDTYMSPSTKASIDYFIRSVRTGDPIKVVGYAYTLERIALAVKEKHIQAIENILPSGINATRCLRVHSSVGSDVEHVDEALETIAQLSFAERTQIAIACYETAKLYFSSHENDYPSATELKQKLQPFRH